MKEPAQLWIWLIIAVLLFFCVPYFFAGAYGPLILGLYWPRFSREAAIAGLLTGTLTVSVMMLTGAGHIRVFDAGVCGFMTNGFACVSVCLLTQPSEVDQQRVHERFFTLFERPPSGPVKGATLPIFTYTAANDYTRSENN